RKEIKEFMESKGRDSHGKLISTMFDNIKGDLTHFLVCKVLVENTDKDILRNLCSQKKHDLIQKLRENFEHRFSDFKTHEKSFDLFQNPSLVSLKKSLERCSLSSSTCRRAPKPDTYICEKTFSTMAINNSTLRSRLTDGHLHDLLHIATTEVEPDIRGPTGSSTTNPLQ
uniref:Uncharacterized protein n=1 Tax=Oryzias sinensis TaxID=183150 RepID=A0A8C7X7E9_9TELE